MALSSSIATRIHQAKCRIESANDEGQVLSCENNTGNASLRASVEIEYDQGKIGNVRVLHLQMPGDANIWQPRITLVSKIGQQLKLVTGIDDRGLSPRLSNGDRIKALNLRFNKQDEINLEIEIIGESIALDQMISHLLEANRQGISDSLSSRPFRRQSIVTDLPHLAGFDELEWLALRSPTPTKKPSFSSPLTGVAALLQPYCARCHSDNSLQPPGFLYGNRPNHQIRQCAPRIAARLRAWQPEYGISKSPMPPPASLALSGAGVAQWTQSDEYRALLSAAEQLLEDNFSHTRYDDLPPCFTIP